MDYWFSSDVPLFETGRSLFAAADRFMLRRRQTAIRTSKSPYMGKVSLLIRYPIDRSMGTIMDLLQIRNDREENFKLLNH